MNPNAKNPILPALLALLLLSSCAVNLRLSEPAIPADPTPAETAGPEEEPETEPSPLTVETDPPETEPRETETPETESPETEPVETDPVETEPAEPDPPEEEPEPKPEEPSWLAGRAEDGVWRNDGLNLRYVLPGENWIFAGEDELASANAELPDGTVYDMRAVSEEGSSVLVMARRIPEPDPASDGEEVVTLGEYVAILSDGMLESGGEDAKITAGEPEERELAGESWLGVRYEVTWFGEYPGTSVWLTREADGWFVTVAATGSPADWLDADGILAMLTAADSPMPEKPEKPVDPADLPAVFHWGDDSLDGGVYRCGFAGIAVAAPAGWTFADETALIERNGFEIPEGADRETICGIADKASARCVMRLSNEAGASAELSFIRADVFGEGGWEQYASFLVDNLLESGTKAGFAMSVTDGEWAELAGTSWFTRIVTFSSGGYPVGQQMLLWRPVGGELVELTLDNGVWTDIPLADMTAMFSAYASENAG